MAKRRTSGIQRRQRASADALNRRLDAPGSALPDWRLMAIGGVLAAGVILVVVVLITGSAPNPNAGTAQPDDGRTHVTDGYDCRSPAGAAEAQECGADPYSSLPATSGPHWNTPNNWGVYSTPQRETQLIHNLEHGGIVIWYDPEALDQAGIDRLTTYVNNQVSGGLAGRFRFILSPWGGEDFGHPIAVTAWRNLLYLDQADTGAIDDFARAHYGRAPEPNGGPGPPGS